MSSLHIEHEVGIVEKMWSAKGSIKRASSPCRRGRVSARDRPRRHPCLLSFTYRIHKSILVTVGQGKIAYVFARDGAPLAPSQVLASMTARESGFPGCPDVSDERRPKGPQRTILREAPTPSTTTQFAIIHRRARLGHALSGAGAGTSSQHEADHRRSRGLHAGR